MTKQYRLHSYNVQPRVGDAEGDGAHAIMDKMTQDGWEVHTANVLWPEATILWERDAPEDEDSADSPDDEAEAASDSAPASPAAASSGTTRPKTSSARGRRAGAPSG